MVYLLEPESNRQVDDELPAAGFCNKSQIPYGVNVAGIQGDSTPHSTTKVNGTATTIQGRDTGTACRQLFHLL
jgi:hypothetical protein